LSAIPLAGAPAGNTSAGAVYERWGREAPRHLEGDFAFAIEDARDGSVFAARDAMGNRPLYYRVSGRRISFAGSAAGVAAADRLPLETDPRRIADALVPGLEAADHECSPYRGVKRLPPGHRLRFRDGILTIDRWWCPSAGDELRLASDGDYVDAFRETFGTAVRDRLTGGSASMLSGGLDSSAIVAFGRTVRPLTTLSAIHDETDCEETASVLAVEAEGRLDPVHVRPSDLPAFRAAIEKFWELMEEPFDAEMILPLVLYRAAAARGFDAVLDGVDGDAAVSLEPSYLEAMLRAGAWGRASREAAGLARFYAGSYAPWASAPRLLLGAAGRGFAPTPVREWSRRLRRPGRLQEALEGSSISPDLVREADVHERLEALWARRGSTGASMRERHVVEVTHPAIAVALERYHRVAASQGIEARHPFMDRRVVELGLSLPWDQKVRDGWSKHVVRRACAGLLADRVAWRRGRWVRLGPDFLSTAIASFDALIAREATDGLRDLAAYADVPLLLRSWGEHRLSGRPVAAQTLWRAAAVNSWLRRSRDRMYHPPRRANGPIPLTRVPVAGWRSSH
jgi:asparagine synthase (glutamine-hydrolysing)